MNKNVKKLLILIILIMLFFTLYKVITTYAIFYSELSGTAKSEVGEWSIVVNDTDISSGQTQTFSIDNIELTMTNYVRQGKIAPGFTGKFKIKIDPSNTQTSIKYTMSINTEELPIDRIKIVNVEEESGNELIKIDENTYVGIISLADIQNGKINTIQVEVQWEDDGMHDEEDAIWASSDNPELNIPIQVDVMQYLGEEI